MTLCFKNRLRLFEVVFFLLCFSAFFLVINFDLYVSVKPFYFATLIFFPIVYYWLRLPFLLFFFMLLGFQFVLFSGFSAYWSLMPLLSIKFFFGLSFVYLYFSLIVCSGCYIVRSAGLERVDSLVSLLFSSVFLLSISFYFVGLVLYFLGHLVDGQDFAGLTIDRGIPRFIGFMGDPNIMALILMPMFFFFLEKGSSLLSISIAFGVLLTFSIGGAVSFAVSLLFFVKKTNYKVFFVSLFSVVLISGLVLYLGSTFLEDLARMRLASLETGSGRFRIWDIGLDSFLENPIFGSGSFTYQTLVNSELGFSKFAHNTYLEVLVELGVAGFLFFLLFILMVLFLAFFSSSSWVFPALISMLVMIAGVSALSSEAFYCLLGICIVYSFKDNYNSGRKYG